MQYATNTLATIVLSLWIPGLFGPAAHGQGACNPIVDTWVSTTSKRLGWSIDVDANVAAVGAPATFGVGVGPDAGAVHVYVTNGTSWSQQARLDGLAPFEYFGRSVAIDMDTVAIGAPTAGVVGTGAVYVYTRNGTTWSFQQKLVGSGVQAGDWFGESVALDGDVLVAGCRFENHATGRGTAYAFRRNGTTWSEEVRLLPGSFPSTLFGTSVSVEGNRIAVGDPQWISLTDSGQAFVFERVGPVWSLAARLQSTDAQPGQAFGTALHLSGDSLLVGAAGTRVPPLRDVGAA